MSKILVADGGNIFHTCACQDPSATLQLFELLLHTTLHGEDLKHRERSKDGLEEDPVQESVLVLKQKIYECNNFTTTVFINQVRKQFMTSLIFYKVFKCTSLSPTY